MRYLVSDPAFYNGASPVAVFSREGKTARRAEARGDIKEGECARPKAEAEKVS